MPHAVLLAGLSETSAAYLLHEELCTAHDGRIDGEILVVVRVGKARCLPIVSREARVRGILRARRPKVDITECHDYLRTLISGRWIDTGLAARYVPAAPTFPILELAVAFEPVGPLFTAKHDMPNI